MPNYSNGKIYKITGGGLTYIGSTTQSLARRLAKHKSEKNVGRFGSSNVLFDFDDYMITLVEDYPCERREQLLMRERYWYDNIECINKIPPLTDPEQRKEYEKQYNQNHKNTEYKRQYFQDNKEKIYLRIKNRKAKLLEII